MVNDSSPFDWDAERYAALPLPHVRWGLGVLERLDLEGTERLLDLGCGTGRDAGVALATHPGLSVVGLDASPAMLEAARETLAPYHGRFQLTVADLRDGFTLAAPADAAMSVAALHWIPDHRPVFESVHAALRPGGRFVAECGGRGNIARLEAALARTIGEATDAWEFADVEDTAALLRAAGFVDVRARLRPDPLLLTPESLPSYLATVMLGKHLAGMSRNDGAALVTAVAAAMDEPIIDYVRLEFEATRA
ncbi:MAG: class I SAM-dependent methyltransferase [Propionibacteriaceae bacterium]|mgnify:CR=1 FL=1|nr:methyltransferase domain-containing protein [Micropruina sp.]HBX80308.1 class I SAM-dependent methyltransferase [Propionibacteriaceae bacterium]HBY21783.1 class I SAM-dependent methyltransferase [Propionibacteriaceae bacterium]